MKIADMLAPNAILANLMASGKREVLEELSQTVASAHPELSQAKVLATLLEREKLGSTGVGEGIAIPHGKLAGLPKIIVGFGRSAKGINFDAIDGRPVHILFLLLAPEDSPGTHLKALARISRLLKDVAFREKLMAAKDAAELMAVIQREDEAIG
jgi:PTS system nitrogen regulatory IIA component